MTASELLAEYLHRHNAARATRFRAPLGELFADDAEMFFAGLPFGPFAGRAAILAAFAAHPPDDDLVGLERGGEGNEAWCPYAWASDPARACGALVLREADGKIARLIVTAVPHGAAVDEAAYLAAGDPRAQSGFRGDARRWTALRRIVTAPMSRPGRFLDVGCANGLLMESVAAWNDEVGVATEPWGVDVSAALADLARARLPAWRDRIFAADAARWEPPVRFDAVRTELVYAPANDRASYVARLARRFLNPGGRLIVCTYASARVAPDPPEPPAEWLRAHGFEVAGEAVADRDPAGRGGTTRVAWMENAE
ncbi:MAG: methyltransferase domain-containing protein [Planctomycetes bacterium]|nr:methyltransferase domain-containing protein [Planctomycetota bacterium]